MPKIQATRSNFADGNETPVESSDEHQRRLRAGRASSFRPPPVESLYRCDLSADSAACQDSVQMLYSRCMEAAGALRIGELSRRTGVSPELLRAWERRYGLLQPTRSTGGLRLYAPADLARVQAMQQHLAEGFAAAEAATLAARRRGTRRRDRNTGRKRRPCRRASELRRRRCPRRVRRAPSAALDRHAPARCHRSLPA